jgi:NitT/TauT family transport system permease protein
LQISKPLPSRNRSLFAFFSFVLPVLAWCVVSYVPAVWHPQILVTKPGSISFLEPGMRMDRSGFLDAAEEARKEKKAVPEGIPANPIYLPAPHEVAQAFYTSFTTPPESRDGQWLHESLWHSIQVIFWGFVISSLVVCRLGFYAAPTMSSHD